MKQLLLPSVVKAGDITFLQNVKREDDTKDENGKVIKGKIINHAIPKTTVKDVQFTLDCDLNTIIDKVKRSLVIDLQKDMRNDAQAVAAKGTQALLEHLRKVAKVETNPVKVSSLGGRKAVAQAPTEESTSEFIDGMEPAERIAFLSKWAKK